MNILDLIEIRIFRLMSGMTASRITDGARFIRVEGGWYQESGRQYRHITANRELQLDIEHPINRGCLMSLIEDHTSSDIYLHPLSSPEKGFKWYVYGIGIFRSFGIGPTGGTALLDALKRLS